MKSLLLIPALMLGSVAMATEYNYEITPLIGYNIAEGNIDLDDYAVFGAELQYNGFDSIIKPELSILYSNADYEGGSADTDVWRVAVNGVYEYDKVGSVIPLAKAGLGYEHMSDAYTSVTGNEDNCAFVDFGVGAKIPFNEMIALKLEAVYMLKYNDARFDNNLALLAGLNIACGEKAQKAAPVAVTEPEPTPEPAPVVAAAPMVVDGDDDKDGVLNSADKCPTTPAGVEVDANGCKVDND
ncbi:MAG: outer membrane beta-barrel protein, partial [Campylobacterota bacterium]